MNQDQPKKNMPKETQMFNDLRESMKLPTALPVKKISWMAQERRDAARQRKKVSLEIRNLETECKMLGILILSLGILVGILAYLSAYASASISLILMLIPALMLMTRYDEIVALRKWMGGRE
jgi:hypothetical protein